MIAGIPQITGKVAQIIQPVITALRSYVSEFTAAGEEMAVSYTHLDVYKRQGKDACAYAE